jgi:hypothetical protein
MREGDSAKVTFGQRGSKMFRGSYSTGLMQSYIVRIGFKLLKVKVPLICLGTEGVSPPRDRCYPPRRFLLAMLSQEMVPGKRF